MVKEHISTAKINTALRGGIRGVTEESFDQLKRSLSYHIVHVMIHARTCWPRVGSAHLYVSHLAGYHKHAEMKRLLLRQQ